jgi:hypothetical protein
MLLIISGKTARSISQTDGAFSTPVSVGQGIFMACAPTGKDAVSLN